MPAAPNTRGGVSDEDGTGEDATQWSWHGEIIAERNAERAVLQGEPLETVRLASEEPWAFEAATDSDRSTAIQCTGWVV